MGIALKHPVPDRVKQSFVIFDIRALWRSALMSKITNFFMPTVGVKGLNPVGYAVWDCLQRVVHCAAMIHLSRAAGACYHNHVMSHCFVNCLFVSMQHRSWECVVHHSYYRQHSTPAVSAPPPEREHHYTQSLRQRSHNFQLPDRTSVLRDNNFIMRMLYFDALYWQIYFFSS